MSDQSRFDAARAAFARWGRDLVALSGRYLVSGHGHRRHYGDLDSVEAAARLLPGEPPASDMAAGSVWAGATYEPPPLILVRSVFTGNRTAVVPGWWRRALP